VPTGRPDRAHTLGEVMASRSRAESGDSVAGITAAKPENLGLQTLKLVPDPTSLALSIDTMQITDVSGRTPGWGGGADVLSDRALKKGDILKDRFVIEEEIGAGGMGVVFKALDLRKKEAKDREPYVALKVLNREFQDNPISLIALQREAKRAQSLSHPNIITVYDFDRDGSRVFMSMEYLDQRPLSRFIREMPEGGLSLEQAWAIIAGMGAALQHAHKKNIVHSDFKPGNVFINDANEIKVLDFGIACAAVRNDQGVGEKTVFDPRSLGALTPAYASLEMFGDDDPDPRDDIYALACVTYELLTGKHPFDRRTALQALALNLQPKPVPGLSRRQRRALEHGLALTRSERTPSVEQFLRELQPRSLVSFRGVLAGGLALVLSVAMTFVLLKANTPAERPRTPVILTAEQQVKIKDLLEMAEMHFEVGYLTAPAGSNALWAYQEVLKLDPYNEAATAGVKTIADALEQAARDLYQQGKTEEGMRKVLEGLEADPQHEGLLKLKGALQD
jgi:serine/threonine protein kinase